MGLKREHDIMGKSNHLNLMNIKTLFLTFLTIMTTFLADHQEDHQEDKKEGDQVTISPIFYEQIFHMKVFGPAFICLQFGFVIFL